MSKSGRIAVIAVPIVVVAAAVFVAAGGVALVRQYVAPPVPVAETPTPAAPSAPVVLNPRVLATLPEFVLENELGQSLDLYDLHGVVWVADFIFTHCGSTCPLLTRVMSDLNKELAASPTLKEVQLVSFSVDPEVDTPEVLRAYGHENGADARWTFLTGTRDAVRNLVRGGFKLPVQEQADPKMPIAHSQDFVLVDREGRVRGVYDALTEDGRKELREALARVIAEPRVPDVFVPADLNNPTWLAPRQKAQIAAAASMTVPHDFHFTDRIGASGITWKNTSSVDVGKFYRAIHYDHGTAVAVADVDGDGLLDVFFANQNGKNGLFRNRGQGRFEDITESGGVGVGGRACVGAAFADVDNDGDPDLFVTSVREGNILFLNDGHGHFKDVTMLTGMGGNGCHASGSVFFDYDADGLLDSFVTCVGKYTIDQRRPDGLYIGHNDAFAGHLHPDRLEHSLLYHNVGGGHFNDVTQASGLDHAAWSGDATAFDYDEDGRMDLYVLSMQGHDELWHNLGGGKFERRSREVFPATPWGSMGVKSLDWNGDGHMDLYVTDMHTDMSTELAPENDKKKHDPATMFPFKFLNTDGNHILGNALYTSQGGGKYLENSDAANVETGWPWGPSAGDSNADGWPDSFVAGGMNYPFRYEGNQVLLNEGGKHFVDSEFVLGIEPRTRYARPWFDMDCDGPDAWHKMCQEGRHGTFTVWASRASRSAALFDLDGDGDLDIITSNYNDIPQVFVSDLASKHTVHSLTVKLVGRRSNRDGIGAMVTVQADGHAQLQANDGKSGYLAQSVMPMYFGLGAADHADSIKVKWPTGKVQTVRGSLKSGTPVIIKEP